MSEPQFGAVDTSSGSSGSTVSYSSVTLQGHEYNVGDSAYFNPDSFTFNVKLPPAAKKSKQDHTDTKPVLIIVCLLMLTDLAAACVQSLCGRNEPYFDTILVCQGHAASSINKLC